jgi:hypothetical protein
MKQKKRRRKKKKKKDDNVDMIPATPKGAKQGGM